MIEQIIAGLIGALTYGLIVYQKNKAYEDFDWKKFVPTLVIGLVIGAIAGVTNVSYDIVADSAVIGFLTMFVQNTYKAIMNQLS